MHFIPAYTTRPAWLPDKIVVRFHSNGVLTKGSLTEVPYINKSGMFWFLHTADYFIGALEYSPRGFTFTTSRGEDVSICNDLMPYVLAWYE